MVPFFAGVAHDHVVLIRAAADAVDGDWRLRLSGGWLSLLDSSWCQILGPTIF